jgi:hypothetical protein
LSKIAIVAGSVAQRPAAGGHTWVFLQYLLGFRGLGWDVTLIDRLEPEMCFDEAGRSCPLEASVNLRYLQEVAEGHGLDGSYALLYDRGTRCLGMSREKLLERVSQSSLMLNVNGFVDEEQVLERAPLSVFLDIDPGFGQMWRELGLHDPFRGHDVYVTIGENIGQPDCEIPTGDMNWLTTPQPVVLDHWPIRTNDRHAITSVASWRGPSAPIEYRGKTYGLRAHEFRRFASLPQKAAVSFEIALEIDSSDQKDIDLLRENGWKLVDPHAVAHDPGSYQRYVQSSKAEIMIAKSMYVEARSGWFSDRSICYLASGKPVLAQDTGFGRRYATGEGLLSFTTVEEAADAVQEVLTDYRRHCQAARGLAEEYFDSRKVLGRLVSQLGVA